MATYAQEGKKAEQKPTMPHKLILDERNRLEVSGTTEVISFDDTTVALKTVKGALIIHGQSLQLQTLSLDNGLVAVQGEVSSLVYEPLRKEGGSFLSRLFG